MKYLKMLGLAAFAAMALMAFGAGTASATKLCTDSACATVYPSGTEIHATLVKGGTATLTASGGIVDTCPESTVAGKTSAKEGTPLTGSIETLTWSSSCTSTTNTVALGSLSIEKSGTNEGKVSGSGSQVTVVMFGTSCTYGTGNGTALGTIKGGTAPIMSINAVGLTKTAGNFLCPSSATWNAEYVVTSPHAVYIG